MTTIIITLTNKSTQLEFDASNVNQTRLICVIRLKQIQKEGAYSQPIFVIVNHSLLEGTLPLPVNLLKVHLSKIVSHK